MIVDVSSWSPIIFEMGPFVIRWYAIAYILGFVIGWQYCLELIKNNKGKPNKIDLDDLLTWLVVGVILGGRLGYVLFYNPVFYLSEPLSILKVWEGGMSFHGGAIGVIISIYLFSRKQKLSFLKLSDLICAAAPIGLLFGRIANFINNELWGRVTNGSWGVIFRDGVGDPRHPSQLYEAFLEGLLLFILLNIIYKMNLKRKGVVSGAFLIFYGLFRILIEFFREPDVQIGYIFDYITMGQMLSLPMIIVGALVIKKAYK